MVMPEEVPNRVKILDGFLGWRHSTRLECTTATASEILGLGVMKV
jgi:hypothetical protein